MTASFPASHPVTTRFAPSPTGAMHIGNARAALFNWLYARHVGGRFLLRIEDTDRERHSDAAVELIYDTLRWLDLDWDGEPVLQSANAPRHADVVQALQDKGHAFRCFLTPEEAEALKTESRALGQALRSPWRDADPSTAPTDRSFVVRLRVPEGETLVPDVVRGDVRFPNKDLDDMVLLRSDGTPTYNLAVTVDDHDMGVSHVIRGEEHLSNAARQTLLYTAMDWPVPTFAHLPLIMGDDGQKLSKRHGAQSVQELQAAGYLPEALRNYLARLGWGHGNDELFSIEQAVSWFDIVDVVRSPARFDMAKLNHTNAHYIRLADVERLAGLVETILRDQDITLAADVHERLIRVIPLVRESAQTLVKLAELTEFAVIDATAPGIPALPPLDAPVRTALADLANRLRAVEPFTPAELEPVVRDAAAAADVPLRQFGPSLRKVLSAGRPAPDLASTLAALGRDEALSRIEAGLAGE